ncbi:MAG: hypothetical protein NVS3B26_18650 [Mycobacteriales bacterium]
MAVAPYAVVSSDLSRASDTAAAVAAVAGLAVVTDRRLREISLGAWEGLTGEEARVRFPAEHAAWVAGEDVRRGGGETYGEVACRASAAVTEVLSSLPAGRTLVVVTHGGTARAMLGSLLDLPPADWWRLAPLGNTCWSVLVDAVRGWRLERHNAGLGPLVGPATGAHDVGSRPIGSPDAEPVK